MIENIRLAFQGIWSHKMRSFLTMLGIIIGIAAIIAIVSTIQGTNNQIKESLIGSGNNAVDVLMMKNGNELSFYSSSDLPSGIYEVTEETKQKILDLDTVVSVTCYSSRTSVSDVFYLNTDIEDANMYGIDMNYFTTCSYTLKSGRNFIQEDYDTFRKVAIIDSTAASNLFGNSNPLGKTLEISGNPFTIVGVVASTENNDSVITSISNYYNYADDSNGSIFIPKADWPILYLYDEPENVVVRATSTDDMEKAGEDTAEILNATIVDQNSEVKYKPVNLAEQARKIASLSSQTNMQLIWIASISLLVGGIGVMNIMLVSVTERTNEIGLKKAIGARKSTILGQFLTEAAVLTSLGGLIGVASGIGMATVISKFTGAAVAINIPSAIIAVAFSMLIGIIFGFLPSVQAANLDPIEALRRE